MNEYFERVNTCINAYSNTAVMHSTVIAALMGEVKMTGQSPVDINIENFTKNERIYRFIGSSSIAVAFRRSTEPSA